ncbi:MAG TPA: aminodeoxychorismate/anthranilate synthase component II [Puia sp.]|nr:aminodeoxychorismate/anthranilate synthase component II [Puia sp.]
MTRILVFDNYDSFTYNLVHLVEKISHLKVEVHRNDQIPLEKIKEFDKIILSPGPGIPSEAGLLLPLIREYAASKPILGVCLGHQAIGEAFGGTLVNLSAVYHGVATPVRVIRREGAPRVMEGSSPQMGNVALPKANGHAAADLFRGLPDELEVGRYHSWVIREEGFPDELEVTARDERNMIMALRHKNLDVQGVQFHPESVLTPMGEQIMRNWLAE